MSDHAHPPRAADVEELRQLQKSVPRERDEQQEERRTVSLSETLRSGARPVSGRCAPAAVVGQSCGPKEGGVAFWRRLQRHFEPAKAARVL